MQKLISGKDSHPRVERIKIENGDLLRPIQKRYNLENPKELFLDLIFQKRSGRTASVPKRYKY